MMANMKGEGKKSIYLVSENLQDSVCKKGIACAVTFKEEVFLLTSSSVVKEVGANEKPKELIAERFSRKHFGHYRAEVSIHTTVDKFTFLKIVKECKSSKISENWSTSTSHGLFNVNAPSSQTKASAMSPFSGTQKFKPAVFECDGNGVDIEVSRDIPIERTSILGAPIFEKKKTQKRTSVIGVVGLSSEDKLCSYYLNENVLAMLSSKQKDVPSKQRKGSAGQGSPQDLQHARKEKHDNTCIEVTGQLKGPPEMPPTVMSDSDDTEGNDIDESKEYQNGASLNNNPSQRPGFESQENFSASSPLHSKGSSSESPQFFPPNTENTSSDGKSLQSEQLQNLIVYEEIPDEENRTSSTEHFYENIVADQQIRPGLLMQNSYHGDREERSDHDEGGCQDTRSPKPYQLPTMAGRQKDPGNQQARVLHVQQDSLVRDVIVSNASAMDIISLHMDRSVYPGNKGVPVVQRWEHLADEFEVPNLTKKKCGNMSATLSPSERMFQHLRMNNPSLPIADLKKHLENVKRNDVVEELNKNSSLSSDDATVTDLWEKHFSTLSTVCIMLDDMDCPYNYKHLASWLGISGSTLRTFKYGDSSESPSMIVLKILETQKPNLSTDHMVVALTSWGLKPIAEELKCQPPGSTIQTLLDNLEVSEVITALLDENDSYWLKFGHKFGIDRDTLDSLRPDPIKSPAKAMINFIVSRDPDLRMGKFMEILSKIEHNKLIEKLKTMLHISWI